MLEIVDKLREIDVLLIAAENDLAVPVEKAHTPLVNALLAQNTEQFKHTIVPQADHAFSSHRLKLAEILLDWLRNS